MKRAIVEKRRKKENQGDREKKRRKVGKTIKSYKRERRKLRCKRRKEGGKVRKKEGGNVRRIGKV